MAAAMERERVERVIVAGHRLPAAEAEVLKVLLAAGTPLLVGEVQGRLDGRTRAHTTVLTLLSRLTERGLVDREPGGRGHRYFAVGTERELAVDALERVLGTLDDPSDALLAFIDRLPARTRRGLTRRLLGEADR